MKRSGQWIPQNVTPSSHRFMTSKYKVIFYHSFDLLKLQNFLHPDVSKMKPKNVWEGTRYIGIPNVKDRLSGGPTNIQYSIPFRMSLVTPGPSPPPLVFFFTWPYYIMCCPFFTKGYNKKNPLEHSFTTDSRRVSSHFWLPCVCLRKSISAMKRKKSAIMD